MTTESGAQTCQSECGSGARIWDEGVYGVAMALESKVYQNLDWEQSSFMSGNSDFFLWDATLSLSQGGQWQKLLMSSTELVTGVCVIKHYWILFHSSSLVLVTSRYLNYADLAINPFSVVGLCFLLYYVAASSSLDS